MVALIVVVVVLAVALAALSVVHFRHRLRRPIRPRGTRARRILFPFVAHALAPRALDAALRLATAENATLVPVFLARVSLDLPLDTPLPRQSAIAIPLQEAIEQRATEFGVLIEARIERGRTYRHALRQTIADERFDRIVIAAAAHGGPGFDPDDVAWLLDNAPGEIVVLRADKDEQIGPPPSRGRRRPRTRSTRGRAPQLSELGSARPQPPRNADPEAPTLASQPPTRSRRGRLAAHDQVADDPLNTQAIALRDHDRGVDDERPAST
jgi:nucleotide-binding universal stress UspA family protein